MKTSFYFFLWIIIYPLLSLIQSPLINRNSFIVALFVVWGLSWILNRNMPDTIRYERLASLSSVLEEVYTGNIHAFRKRLSRRVTVDFITAIYLGVGFVFILFNMVKGSADDWIALMIFGFFAFGALSRAVKLNKVNSYLGRNPDQKECVRVVEETYHIDYSSYSNARMSLSPEAILPPEPKHFKAFQIFSLVIAIVCSIFGFYFLVMSILLLSESRGADSISAGVMYFLYGTLAVYFGIKDSAGCISFFRRKKV